MANLLESSATTTTTTPGYYTDYLSNLATAGTEAAKNAKFADVQPLQQKAFDTVEKAATDYQPTLTAAGNTLNQATTAANPLASATPYLSAATSDPSQAASQYMTPYIRSVIDSLGDVGARNIRQNLSPLATSAAVGSGQFGSKRGAEVLGQTIGNANRDVLNAQAGALNTGYQNALNAAIQQNQIEGTAGATAANAASQGQANLTAAGRAQGELAKTDQDLDLAGVNALSTLGGQQQTIAQNKENYPLTKLSTVSGLMAGQTIPTTNTQTASASPLSLLASGTTGLAGLFSPKTDEKGNPLKDAAGNYITNYASLTSGLKNAGSDIASTVKDWYKSATSDSGSGSSGNGTYTDLQEPPVEPDVPEELGESQYTGWWDDDGVWHDY